jgi:hypothetical protein
MVNLILIFSEAAVAWTDSSQNKSTLKSKKKSLIVILWELRYIDVYENPSRNTYT